MAKPSRQNLKIRLREDRVALGILRKLDAELRAHVPKGKAVLMTFGAPIKVPRQLVAALTALLLKYFERGAEETDVRKTILGNRVRFRVLKKRPAKWKSPVIGFVFTGDPLPSVLAETVLAVQDEATARAEMRRGH